MGRVHALQTDPSLHFDPISSCVGRGRRMFDLHIVLLLIDSAKRVVYGLRCLLRSVPEMETPKTWKALQRVAILCQTTRLTTQRVHLSVQYILPMYQGQER